MLVLGVTQNSPSVGPPIDFYDMSLIDGNNVRASV